jgi:hypothetical protein|tara:strand:- start:378 stop:833 length:456 start_codon:yes stop_codon:yes gene_type:complete
MGTRPLYEKSEDVQRERSVIDFVSSAWNCNYFKLPNKYFMDFALIHREQGTSSYVIKCFTEVKTRNKENKLFPDFMISSNKIYKCRNASKDFSVPVYIIVHTPDGVFYFNCSDKESKIAMCGRFDRNDPMDKESMHFFSWSNIHKLGERLF